MWIVNCDYWKDGVCEGRVIHIEGDGVCRQVKKPLLFEELRDEAYRDCVKNKETVKMEQIVQEDNLDELSLQIGAGDKNETI